MRSPLLYGFLTLVSPMLASAHENPLPQSCLVSDTRPGATTYFSFTPQQLREYKELHSGTTKPVVGNILVKGKVQDCLKDCGIIDEWYWANEAAKSVCSGGAQRGGKSPAAMPYVLSPSTFNLNIDTDGNGFKDHHDEYHFDQGLSGVCIACP